ncbi:MAG: hypothetical protein HAW67_04010 [Endozoicomonadaceae bacterium]|nr:hypothetical protein [Endozoicomonadaceae bacterium]
MTNIKQKKECKNCDTMSDFCEDNCLMCSSCEIKYLDGDGTTDDNENNVCSDKCASDNRRDIKEERDDDAYWTWARS